MSNLIAADIGSITDNFPLITELNGIVVMPYWSTLNPSPGVFDFSIIEKALDYWGSLGRKVVLGVVTCCYPTRSVSGGLTEAVPDWVIARSAIYRQAVSVIGAVKPLETTGPVEVAFPTYWDNNFQQAEADLVDALGRFDAHPVLSRVRICTGIMGEDNPTFDGLRASMPGFSSLAWINYSKRVLNLYHRAFSRTQLEFDIDRMGFIKASGSYGERRAADTFVREVEEDGVFLAMNGLDIPNVEGWLAGRQSGPAASLDYVAQRRGGGYPVGLEGGGVNNLGDADVDLLTRAFRLIRANRFVAFSDSIAAINWCREGNNRTNETSESIYGARQMAIIGALGQRLLDGLELDAVSIHSPIKGDRK